MTQKELAYMEDAIKHEENLALIIKESINLLDDENLVSFMQKQMDNHTAMQKKLTMLLEEKADE